MRRHKKRRPTTNLQTSKSYWSGVLGYHVLGDFSTYLRIPLDVLEGPNNDLLDPMTTTAILTSFHENAHLMQSLTSGFCLNVEMARDQLVADLRSLPRADLQSIGSPILESVGGHGEKRAVEKYPDHLAKRLGPAAQRLGVHLEALENPELTALMFEGEFRSQPQLLDLLGDEVSTLTTRHLVESHALIITQIHAINFAANFYPEHRDWPRGLKEMRSIWDIEHSEPPYRTPYTIFERIVSLYSIEIPDFEIGGSRYPGYLTILRFLLEYSLQTAPGATGITDGHELDTSATQDSWPAFRFVYLCVLWAVRIKSGSDPIETAIRDLDRVLANMVNEMHRLVSPDREDTFFTMAQVTSMYTQLWNDQDLVRRRYPNLHRVRKSALAKVERSDWAVIDLPPGAAHKELGLPLLVETPSGPVTYTEAPFDPSSLPKGEIQRSFGSEGIRFRPNHQFPGVNFVQEVIDRKLDHFGAGLAVMDELATCPLTHGLGAYFECPARTHACSRVRSLLELPTRNCRARDRLLDISE